MKKEDYAEYLKTEHWKAVRGWAMSLAGNKCQVCGRTARLNVHHNNYYHLHHESPRDVVVLCEDCHMMYHKEENGEEIEGGDFWPVIRLSTGQLVRSPAENC